MVEPAPVVLVHGAWFGRWCWQSVEEALAEFGVQATAVDLPGRPGNPMPIEKVTLQGWVDHLEHVVSGFAGPCIVVGHSLAGAALTLLGERRPELINRLVYVAAFLLRAGESATDVIRRDRNTQVHAARKVADDFRFSTLEPTSISTILCNDCPEDAKDAVQANVVPESTIPAQTRVDWTGDRFGTVARTYIVCERDRVIDPSVQRRMIATVGCDSVRSLDTGHSPFLSLPRGLSQLIAIAAIPSLEPR